MKESFKLDYEHKPENLIDFKVKDDSISNDDSLFIKIYNLEKEVDDLRVKIFEKDTYLKNPDDFDSDFKYSKNREDFEKLKEEFIQKETKLKSLVKLSMKNN